MLFCSTQLYRMVESHHILSVGSNQSVQSPLMSFINIKAELRLLGSFSFVFCTILCKRGDFSLNCHRIVDNIYVVEDLSMRFALQMQYNVHYRF